MPGLRARARVKGGRSERTNERTVILSRGISLKYEERVYMVYRCIACVYRSICMYSGVCVCI